MSSSFQAKPLLTPETFWAFNLTLNAVQAICNAHGFDGTTSVERVKRGEVGAVFRVQRNGHPTLFLKVLVRSFDPSPLLREKIVIDYLHEQSDLPVPRWHIAKEPDGHLPYPYAIIEEAAGLDGDVIWPELNRQQQRLLIQSIGQRLSQLHQIPLTPDLVQSLSHVKGSPAYAQQLHSQFVETMADLQSQGWVPPSLLATVQHIWNNKKEWLNKNTAFTLVHHDYQLHNLRIDPISLDVVAILDFGNAAIAPSLSDTRDLEIVHFLDAPHLRHAFWESYGLPSNQPPPMQIIWLHSLIRALSTLAAYWGPTPNGISLQTVEKIVAHLS